MTTIEIQEYLKKKERDEEEQKRQKLQTAKHKLVIAARELLLLESDLSAEESKIISTIFATFHN